ncbi:MAG: hypothetical protein WD231_04175 [Candidatus Woykebacteria bacterium]
MSLFLSALAAITTASAIIFGVAWHDTRQENIQLREELRLESEAINVGHLIQLQFDEKTANWALGVFDRTMLMIEADREDGVYHYYDALDRERVFLVLRYLSTAVTLGKGVTDADLAPRVQRLRNYLEVGQTGPDPESERQVDDLLYAIAIRGEAQEK